jgi:membrane-bound metal-dependent hydrolase YbcI (DUF457 family)
LQRGRRPRFAVGHFGLGYILSKTSAKRLKVNPNVPMVFTLAIIPDIDLLVPGLAHRGATHSVVVAFLVFIPFFAVYHAKAVPYFLALISHSLIGDYVAGGKVQLFWPITQQWYGMEISVRSQTNITIEWIIFIASMIIMLRTRDVAAFFQPHNSNLLLSVPTFTVLLPALLGFPLGVPTWLMLPHLLYIFVFSTSIIIGVAKALKKNMYGAHERIKPAGSGHPPVET